MSPDRSCGVCGSPEYCPDSLSGIDLLDATSRQGRERVFGVTHSTHNMTAGDPADTLQYLWCVEGDSLKPLVENVNAEWSHMAWTSFGPAFLR